MFENVKNYHTIYFDMDGTLADLYQGDWLRELQLERATPYERATPLLDMELLTELLNELQKKGYKIGIVSWTAKQASSTYRKETRRVKVEWLKKYIGIKFDEVHVVKYGTPKSSVAKENGILFDDELQNRGDWVKRGKGFAFDETVILQVLGKILEE